MRIAMVVLLLSACGCEPAEGGERAEEIVLHELTHWVGVPEHTEDPYSVMFYRVSGVSEYSSEDEELICGHLECGCEEDGATPKPLWVDNRCNLDVVEVVETAVDKMNEFGQEFKCRDLVTFEGTTDNLDVVNVVICHPGYPDDPGTVAHANTRTIGLYPSILF